MNLRACLAAFLVTCAAAACGTTETRPTFPANRRLIDADREPGSWLTHGGTYSEQRFSPRTTLTPDNVSGLGLAWSYELRTTRGAEATPLVVDGVMYVTSSWSIVYALDAKTGKELWVYDPEVDKAVGARACCDVVNRGVAFYDGRIYVGAIDGRLIALDAKSGAVAWQAFTVDHNHPYTITGAPRAANGLVFIGNGGAEYGVRGYVTAYDARTAAFRWRFYTVPGEPSTMPAKAASDSIMGVAAATWTGEWWKLGGGGTVYDAIVYDEELDQLIFGVGNGSPWNRQIRSPGGGDNLFLASIVAVDATSGVYKWHYQTAPGDTWDYNATQPIVLADLTIDGAVRKVAMQAPKNGFFYVIERRDGRLISAKPFVPMYRTAETPKGMAISWAYGGFLAPSEVGLVKGRVYVFKMGGTAPKPAPDRVQAARTAPPSVPITPDQYARGAQIYSQFCVACHGAGAIAGGAVPDLRKSRRLGDAAVWSRIVHTGELGGRGLPGFGEQLTNADAELVRGYVAKQAARP